jgi:autotransporter passenger strand-loop-strand repeat protein
VQAYDDIRTKRPMLDRDLSHRNQSECPRLRKPARIAAAIAIMMLAMLAAAPAQAATRTWDGSTNNVWSEPSNWVENMAPVSGDDLVFPAIGPNPTSINDLAGLEPQSIAVTGSYGFSGNAIILRGGGMQLGAGVTVNWQIFVFTGGPQGWIVPTGSTLLFGGGGQFNHTVSLDVDGTIGLTTAITGSAAPAIVKDGDGTIRAEASNTHRGTVINAGRFVVVHANALGATTGVNTTVVNAGGALLVEGDGVTVPSLTLNGNGPEGSGALQAAGATDVSITAATINVSGNSLARVETEHTLRLHAALSGPHQFALTGGGTLVLNGTVGPLGQIVAGLNAADATTVRLGPLFANAMSGPPRMHIEAGATVDIAGRDVTFRGLTGTGRVRGGAGLTVVTLAPDVDAVFGGKILDKTNVAVTAGRQTFTAYVDPPFGIMDIYGGTSIVAGTAGLAMQTNVHAGGRLSLASGAYVGGVTVNAGGELTLSEGGPQSATTAGLDLKPGGILSMTVTGNTNGCSLLTVQYASYLKGTLNLTLAPGAVPMPGTMCTLVNQGSGPFEGRPEGAPIDAGGTEFRIGYHGGISGHSVTASVGPRIYYLSEGNTGTFFDLDIALANHRPGSTLVKLEFLRSNGAPIEMMTTIPAYGRRTVAVDQIEGLEDAAVSTVVTSVTGEPIIVERTMRWDATGYGAHTEKATDGAALTWYFAEGSQGFFQTYVLLANPGTEANTATIQYLLEGGAPIVKRYPMTPNSRLTVDAGAEGLTGQSFGMIVSFERPGVAERAMYFGSARLFDAGHESAGVTAPATEWFLAEGATGTFFETFVLLANPTDTDADATVRFLPSEGVPVTLTRRVPARQRVTLNIEVDAPSLANAAVATQVTSTQPVVVERAQYWPGAPDQWYEAHNSFGVTQLGTRWGLAEGRDGGAAGYQTFILLANPGTEPATVDLVQLLPAHSRYGPFTHRVVVQPGVRVTLPSPIWGSYPGLDNSEFGAFIQSDRPIAVERAMYSSALGQVFAAGTNATATRLP